MLGSGEPKFATSDGIQSAGSRLITLWIRGGDDDVSIGATKAKAGDTGDGLTRIGGPFTRVLDDL